jgi:hypothetical protein
MYRGIPQHDNWLQERKRQKIASDPRRESWILTFLESIVAGATISEACWVAGISAGTFYRRRKIDADLAEAFDLAKEVGRIEYNENLKEPWEL